MNDINEALQEALNNPPKISHKPHTEETKEKIRLSKLGKRRTEEWRQYIRIIRKIMVKHDISYRHAQRVYKVYRQDNNLEQFK